MDEAIEALNVQMEQLQIRNAQLVALSKRPAAIVPMLSIALTAAHRAIEGCFVEWSDRQIEDESDATLIVALTITPDGVGTLPRILSTPDEHPEPAGGGATAPRSILEMCASEQLIRVRFPSSSELLHLEVTLQWSRGAVKMSPKLLEHRPVPHGRIEL
jgi:hypothetical protein